MQRCNSAWPFTSLPTSWSLVFAISVRHGNIRQTDKHVHKNSYKKFSNIFEVSHGAYPRWKISSRPLHYSELRDGCPIFKIFDLISNIIFSATLREHEPNFSWRSISFITWSVDKWELPACYPYLVTVDYEEMNTIK